MAVLKEFQVVCSIVDIVATGDIFKFRAPFTGKIKEIHLWTDQANTNGDNVFNLNVSASDLYSGPARPKISQSATYGSKTGLTDSVIFGDPIILQLESMATGGVKANLTLQIIFETFNPALPANLPYWAVYEPFRSHQNVDGDFVHQLVDSSGNKRNAYQTTLFASPLYYGNQVNGLPALDYAPFGATLKSLLLPTMAALTGCEMWHIAKLNSGVQEVSNATGIQKIGTSGQNTHYSFPGGSIYDDFGKNSRHSFSRGSSDLSIWHVGSWISISGEWTYSYNGTSVNTTGTNIPAFTASPELGRSVSVGFDGKIAGTYIFSAKLESTQRANLKTYINNVFGFSL